MEERKIKRIITAIGNPKINTELKKIKRFDIKNNDIQYKEGILELLEYDKKIDYIILNYNLTGNIDVLHLIKEILKINENIIIIILIKKYERLLKNIYELKNVYRVLCNEEVEINDILKIIDENEKINIYNMEIIEEIKKVEKSIENNKFKKIIFDKAVIKNKILNNKILKKIKIKKVNNKKNNYINKKIITILGSNGSGKSVFSIMLAEYFKKLNKKILIIDFDVLNNSLHTILGIKKYNQNIKEMINININNIKEDLFNNYIININKNLDLISGMNLIIQSNKKIDRESIKSIIKNISKNYDFVIIDTTCECLYEYLSEICKISDFSIFLMEANISEIAKSNRLLEIYLNNWNLEHEKIKIIFNKYNKMCIDFSLLKKIYSEYDLIGTIDMNSNYNIIINSNLKNLILKNIELKKYKKIIKELINSI